MMDESAIANRFTENFQRAFFKVLFSHLILLLLIAERLGNEKPDWASEEENDTTKYRTIPKLNVQECQ